MGRKKISPHLQAAYSQKWRNIMQVSYNFNIRTVTIEVSGADLTSVNAVDSDHEQLDRLDAGEGKSIFLVRKLQNLVNSKFIIEANGVLQEVESPFQFNAQRATDVNYMTEKVFSFRSRANDKNELFHFIRAILPMIPKNQPMYWGAVSVLGFRVGESAIAREALGRRVIKERSKAVNTINSAHLGPIGLRWWISSGANLLPLAIFYGMFEEAKAIASNLYDIRNLAEQNPMVCWNLAASMLFLAAEQYDKEERAASRQTFYDIYSLCRTGLDLIFSSRNPRILSQYPDCNSLIEIGRNAFAMHATLSGNQFSSGTGYSYPLDLERHKVALSAIYKRHAAPLKKSMDYLNSIEERMNEERLSLSERLKHNE
ncbi:hypothetical protein ABEB22_08840 [Thioclava sp. 'Guangxiensis']|uniref:hypothetical protein n=1 Tax=Thioclava sp. 'Guangxiensis' TaxID=3149044 RepID=UPI003877B3AC